MMIHPSYKEMISKINEGQDLDEAPLVTSRYSIVIAAAKRARQIVSGDDTMVDSAPNDKALSSAVRELYEDKVHILPADAPIEPQAEPFDETDEAAAGEEAAADEAETDPDGEATEDAADADEADAEDSEDA